MKKIRDLWILSILFALMFTKVDPMAQGYALEPLSPQRDPIPEGTRILRDVVYEAVDGRDLRLDLYLPESDDDRPLPLVIWIHGGGWRTGSKQNPRLALTLLGRGYAVASLEYRLSGEAIFPAAIDDCKAGVAFLRLNADRYGIDPERFGVWGASAGGHLAALVGTTGDTEQFNAHPVAQRTPTVVQAVCDWFGPTDFLQMDAQAIPGSRLVHDDPNSPESRFVGGPIQEEPFRSVVSQANPLTYVSAVDPPFLIMHGDADVLVPYRQSVLLHEALREQGVDSTLVVVEGAGHGLGGGDTPRDVLIRQVIGFFDQHLKADRPQDNDSPVEPTSTAFTVTDPPEHMNLNPIYEKFVSAEGYPIVGSMGVNDYALKEAAFLVRGMLAHRPDVKAAMVAGGSRLIVMAHDEFTTDVPEHAHLRPKDYWDRRARGLGGSPTDPVCSCGEENLLGFPGDPYAAENILIHEFAHNMHFRGLIVVDTTFDDRLERVYRDALEAGLWDGTYASTNSREYFAEGVQSWFGTNRPPDGDHNHVDTRMELLDYDPGLAALCAEVFGNDPTTYSRPETRLSGHLDGYDPVTAPRFRWPDHLKSVPIRR